MVYDHEQLNSLANFYKHQLLEDTIPFWFPRSFDREHALSGVEVLDSHTLKIRVVGKYPQFKYWLAMTFFSPIPWEVDAF